MHLLKWALKGVPPPPTLPAPLATCIQLAVNPQLPVADDKHMQKCRSAFGAFHENIGKGVLGGEGGGAGRWAALLARGLIIQACGCEGTSAKDSVYIWMWSLDELWLQAGILSLYRHHHSFVHL